VYASHRKGKMNAVTPQDNAMPGKSPDSADKRDRQNKERRSADTPAFHRRGRGGPGAADKATRGTFKDRSRGRRGDGPSWKDRADRADRGDQSGGARRPERDRFPYRDEGDRSSGKGWRGYRDRERFQRDADGKKARRRDDEWRGGAAGGRSQRWSDPSSKPQRGQRFRDDNAWEKRGLTSRKSFSRPWEQRDGGVSGQRRPAREDQGRSPRDRSRPPKEQRSKEQRFREQEPAAAAKAAGASRDQAPPIPRHIAATDLDATIRAELRVVRPPTVADTVARRLVAAGQLLYDDPDTALAHAMAARRLAPRLGVVREAVGLAAYHAGQWQTAISELRAYHRITGRLTHLAVMADCERALGRPERAIDLYRTADQRLLDKAEAVELLIVAAGARRDMGHPEAAAAMLQVRELNSSRAEPWVARLRYAYADVLAGLGREEEARYWFEQAVQADTTNETDAADRLLELEGVVLEWDEELDADGEDELEPEEFDKELDGVEVTAHGATGASASAGDPGAAKEDAASSSPRPDLGQPDEPSEKEPAEGRPQTDE